MTDGRGGAVHRQERERARDILDAQEGTGPVPLLDLQGAVDLLRRSRRIAMVGASLNPGRPSHGVMRYLMHHGYEILPVNPTTREVLGVRSYRSLEEAAAETGSFDIVDVFRRPEHAPAIAESAVETGARALWLQLGVVNWTAARIAHDAGLAVVMDRCTAMDHRRLRA
ncbi:MAG TPA: CoA-binding protein [Candidatus Caenarcaniphilales bacterium]|nr:CoA-binding protein [Candidatus Caenarcaniphilales bacterium]